jgi:hypothetical protein
VSAGHPYRQATVITASMVRQLIAIGVWVASVASVSMVLVEGGDGGWREALGAVIAFSSLYIGAIGVMLLTMSRRRVERVIARLRRAGRRVVGRQHRDGVTVQRLSAQHASTDVLRPILAALATRLTQDQASALCMIDHLSSLLRTELRGAPDVRPVCEEIAATETYLAVARAALGPRLSAVWEVEPAARGALVPSRLLRPLLPLLLRPEADVGRDEQWTIRGRYRTKDGRLQVQLHLPTRCIASGLLEPVTSLTNSLRDSLATVTMAAEPAVRALSAGNGCDVVAFELPLVIETSVLVEDAAGG